MEQKDKEFLLKDLSARLPYGVKVQTPVINDEIILTCGDISAYFFNPNNKVFLRPYLRPMSSMTEEEKEEFAEVTGGNCSFIDAHGNFFIDFGEFICEGSPVSLSRIVYITNWLYAHHFDVNNLIPKGLALKAPKDMYNRI
jgi:hypothetical protein